MTDLLVKLQIYEGPLDLLLHLIKKNEVNLDDIPVALITAQYLEYLDLMESLNVELAADFLVMAATLTQIKSRLLLPRENDDDDENAQDEELKSAIIDPLLEHMKRGFADFKEAAEALGERQMLGSNVFARGAGNSILEELEPEGAAGENMIEATLFDLVDAFRQLAEKKKEVVTLKFVVENKTIGERIGEIQAFLKAKGRASYEEICADDRGQSGLVLSFLALLEMARTGFLCFYQNLVKSKDLMIYLNNPEAELGDLADLDY